MKSNNKRQSLFSLFYLFVDIWFLFFTQAKLKWFFLRLFLIQTDNWFHKIPRINFMYILLFLFQKHNLKLH